MFSYIKSVLFGGEESPPRGNTIDPLRSGRKSSANGDSSARKQQLKATPIGSKRHMSETGRAQKHITAGVARQDEDCKHISLSLLFEYRDRDLAGPHPLTKSERAITGKGQAPCCANKGYYPQRPSVAAQLFCAVSAEEERCHERLRAARHGTSSSFGVGE